MKKLLSAAGAFALALGLSGCTSVVHGELKAGSHADLRCTVVGFEDLGAGDSDCGKTVEAPHPVPGWSVRSIRLDGQEVLYVINQQQYSDGEMAFFSDDTIQVRQYVHAIVYAVEREGESDIVFIEASDTCAVEKLSHDPGMDLSCATDSLHGRQLTPAEAAVVLPQSLVDAARDAASRSGRHVKYVMNVLAPLTS